MKDRQMLIYFSIAFLFIIFTFLALEVRRLRIESSSKQKDIYELQMRLDKLEDQYSNWSMMTEKDR